MKFETDYFLLSNLLLRLVSLEEEANFVGFRFFDENVDFYYVRILK